ncbi:hypothetical protein N0B16_10295 [Chryseobacterium sp. GMJ5]|uniref:Uncharacterized protein n=1 Tax=Chryseobacterium gilvum TaxID=2976534 RepID=A0ABT2VY35_9FLAO|nr:hypothetical protein [Chryseobacterium gilvum]MCU7614826.1 hypothetical protein [Chryseobacterium gilvum]
MPALQFCPSIAICSSAMRDVSVFVAKYLIDWKFSVSSYGGGA